MAFSGCCVREHHSETYRIILVVHHLLQPIRSLATSMPMGRDHERSGRTHDAAVQMIDTTVARAHIGMGRELQGTEGSRRDGHEADWPARFRALIDANGMPNTASADTEVRMS